jgi:hypothetical protein
MRCERCNSPKMSASRVRTEKMITTRYAVCLICTNEQIISEEPTETFIRMEARVKRGKGIASRNRRADAR